MSGGTAHQTGPGHMFNFQGTGNVFHLKQRILALPTADPINEFLKTLVFPSMNNRWHDICPAVDGTCTWIFSNPEYKKWEQGDGDRLFLIEGGPGCGKSTLFKCLRNNHSAIKKDSSGLKTLVLSFFFKAQGVVLQRSRLGLFRTLLYQLVSKMPNLIGQFLMKDPDEAMLRYFNEVLDTGDLENSDFPAGNALHLMALDGRLEMVKVLLASDMVDINATNPFSCTPLAFAAKEGHAEVVDYLLENGAEPNTNVNYRDSPLFCTLNKELEGGQRIIKALLKQDIPENSSQLALHLVAAKLLGDDKLVRSCVKKKPKLLRPFAQSLEKKTWPEDWEECRRLLYKYIRAYEAEWVKDKVGTASDWLKEAKEKKWWKSKKPCVELL